MDSDNVPEISHKVDSQQYKKYLGEVLDLFDKSDAGDVIQLRSVFREWNASNMECFDESDDVYFGLIDDFLSRSGNFECFVNGCKPDGEKKEKEMSESIALQRQLIDAVTNCTAFDIEGNIIVTNQHEFDRISLTMGFLDMVVNNILNKPQMSSKTSQGGHYFSGLKSMVCTSLLARSAGYKVEFGPEQYDIHNDLDMILTKDDGQRIGLDVTTKAEPMNAVFGFSFFLDDSRTRITDGVANELHLTKRSKLILPSSHTNPFFYDSDYRRSRIGFPSPGMMENFKRCIKKAH